MCKLVVILKSTPADGVVRCDKCLNAWKNVSAARHQNLSDPLDPKASMIPTVCDLSAHLSARFKSVEDDSDEAFFEDCTALMLLELVTIWDVKDPVILNDRVTLVPCCGCSNSTGSTVEYHRFCLVCRACHMPMPLCRPCTREDSNASRCSKRKEQNFEKQTSVSSRMNTRYMTHDHLVAQHKNLYNERGAMKTKLERVLEKLADDETEFNLEEKTAKCLNKALKLSAADGEKSVEMAMELTQKTCMKKLDSSKAEVFSKHNILDQLDGFVKRSPIPCGTCVRPKDTRRPRKPDSL